MRGTGRELRVLVAEPVAVDPARVLDLVFCGVWAESGLESKTRRLVAGSSRHDQSSASSGRRACGRGKFSLRQSFIPITRGAHDPPCRPRQFRHPGYTLKYRVMACSYAPT